MSDSYRITETGSISCPSRGTLEIVSIESGTQDSFVILYEGDASGKRLWDISALAKDTRSSPMLNIPFNNTPYAVVAGTGSGISITIR